MTEIEFPELPEGYFWRLTPDYNSKGSEVTLQIVLEETKSEPVTDGRNWWGGWKYKVVERKVRRLVWPPLRIYPNHPSYSVGSRLALDPTHIISVAQRVLSDWNAAKDSQKYLGDWPKDNDD